MLATISGNIDGPWNELEKSPRLKQSIVALQGREGNQQSALRFVRTIGWTDQAEKNLCDHRQRAICERSSCGCCCNGS